MSPIVVIGDEATCAGFRLAGLDTREIHGYDAARGYRILRG